MKNSFSFLFYVKKSKENLQGKSPIYLRITVNGKRAEISVSRSIEADKWSSSANRAIGKTENIKSLNSYLDILVSKIYRHHRELVEADIEISALTLKNKYLGIGERNRTLITLIEEQNKRAKLQLKPGTYKNYKTVLKHVKGFLKYQYNIDDINIKKVNHQFIIDFEFFLNTKQNIGHNAIVKYLRMLRKHINVALVNEWIPIDPFLKIKRTIKKVKREFLTQGELNSIIEKDLHVTRLAQIKDVFVFACYTGLSYGDLAKLNHNNIVIGMDGEKWIHILRTKTGSPSKIPLLPKALTILKKYENDPICIIKQILLPVISNERYNSYLKEIANLCEIKKNLTTHLARHTFATTITLTKGVSIESVSSMLGHSKISTTQIYAKITDTKVSTEMLNLKKKMAIDNGIKAIDKEMNS
jgi:site-specific recombinase XerD